MSFRAYEACVGNGRSLLMTGGKYLVTVSVITMVELKDGVGVVRNTAGKCVAVNIKVCLLRVNDIS